MEFRPWPKIPRVGGLLECIITEKIDGTNAQVSIQPVAGEPGQHEVCVGSRNRWLEEHKDNFGFFNWVRQPENLDALGTLVSWNGRMYGEWFGSGIQRGYGMSERYFMPFNTAHIPAIQHNLRIKGRNIVPVPLLYKGRFDWKYVECAMEHLRVQGSQVACAKGFPNPEGIVVYFPALNASFKRTFEELSNPKFRKESP